MPRYYMDPDYLLDQLEQEWEEDIIIASNMPSLTPRFKNSNNKKLIQARRSQARQRHINKQKVKDKKATSAAKRKLKKEDESSYSQFW